MSVGRTILHVDMDAFFASVEQLDYPELRGKPVLVGSDRPRGVVCAASYESRAFGCRSAMPLSIAKRLCPHAIIQPVRGRRYREISDQLMSILESHTPLVEPLSIDEAFLDATGTERLFGDGGALAQRIRQRVRTDLGLTCSIGVAPNKFLAKLASEVNKPDGLTVIHADQVAHWLDPMPVERLWGVGPATTSRLHRYGFKTVGDVSRASLDHLAIALGSEATRFSRLARGMDDRPVTPDHQAKSVGHEQTFETDLEDRDEVRTVLFEQVENVTRRLRRCGQKAGSITLKIRFGEFETITRSASLPLRTDVTEEIWQVTAELYDHWARTAYRPVRLIGMAASKLDDTTGQLPLFGHNDHDKKVAVDQATDRINERFGPHAIRRGGSLGH